MGVDSLVGWSPQPWRVSASSREIVSEWNQIVGIPVSAVGELFGTKISHIW